jgi:hypothetical protein
MATPASVPAAAAGPAERTPPAGPSAGPCPAPLDGRAPSPALESAKLAGETARHYGLMRFTMFTVFTTVAAALIAVPFTTGGSLFVHENGFQRGLLCTAGIATSLLFGLAEYRISYLVVFYQRAAYAQQALPAPEGHAGWSLVVGFIMLLPSLLTGVFWLLLALGLLVVPELAPVAAE